MSILIDASTTFIVQGITGREAVNLTRECLDYGAGAKIVGGVTPGRLGRDVHAHAAPREARRAVERARGGGGPTLVESMTYRMKGHAEHDAQAYVPKAEIEEWRAKDPIQRYARVLAETGVAQAADLEAIDSAVAEEVDREVDAAEKAPLPTPDAALRGVYANGGVEHAEPAIVRRNS